MLKVTIVQRVLSKYREPFYVGLKERLNECGIHLELIHGFGNKSDSQRGYLGNLDWARTVQEKYFGIGDKFLVYQPYWHLLQDSHLVIVQQEMSWILNHLLLIRKKALPFKLAFWGHGINRQKCSYSLMNWLKKGLNNRVDWWFSYTNDVTSLLVSNGFDPECITTVQNAIDTRQLVSGSKNIEKNELSSLRQNMGIPIDAPVGIYCGGMYKEKRLLFLLEACDRINKVLPSFRMLFLGGGPQESIVQRASLLNNWIHYLGPVYEGEQIKYFMISDCCLMPGLVGLAILDCFALKTPLVTTSYPFHSPEIGYLENDKNGLMTMNRIDAYSNAVIDLLRNRNSLELLKLGCEQSARKYSIESMVENFTDGVIQCLKWKKPISMST